MAQTFPKQLVNGPFKYYAVNQADYEAHKRAGWHEPLTASSEPTQEPEPQPQPEAEPKPKRR